VNTESQKNPKGRRLGTYTLDKVHVGPGLIEDLIVGMQRVVRHDLKTRADEVDSATLKSAEQIDAKVKHLLEIESNRLVAEAALVALVDGTSGRVQMIPGMSGLKHGCVTLTSC